MADAEIAAAEVRLGVVVPPEARVLYRVTRGRDQLGDIRNIIWDVPVPFDVWALDDPRRGGATPAVSRMVAAGANGGQHGT
jgi:hypothetical protein